ncbi:GDP-L-fucose synthase [Ralstonia sp. 25mfcol4.1]|uniref:GDP-L-fucose synthase family protein n=1 Tax=Burkholderiaceae TaxID=119060 RepID=UPI0004079C83|nr:GDP-L-fucose synthase [Ralstonia sp. 25mfcol4.1]SDP78506.1 GDP-L-fucose synthase [Ralstonia sp. 25mfcol4.1]
MSDSQPNVFVAGHRGMVGSAIVRALAARGDVNLVCRTHAELDLTDQQQVRAFFASQPVDVVYMAAGRVGGIHANNTYRAEFIQQNLAMATNVIHESYRAGVRKMLYLGSSCVYPKLAPQPIVEASLLTGELESTNAPYALAKIAGIMLCQSYNLQYGTDYRCLMPSNLYGPGDNYHPENSHVIPALLRRFHEARKNGTGEIAIWGTGTPRREFLHVDDLAQACLHVMDADRAVYDDCAGPSGTHLNAGSGYDVTIAELAGMVAEAVGYRGEITFDPSRPDGTLRKLLDNSAITSLGWRPRIALPEGLQSTYRDIVRDGIVG